MQIHRPFAVACALALTLPGTGLAQICRGSTPLAGMSFANLAGGVSFFEGGRTVGGSVTAGSSLFGSGTVGRHAYNNPIGLHSDFVGGSVGYEITRGSVSLCPIVGVSHSYGYEVLASELTSTSVSGGVGFGYKAEVEPNVFVVPGVELVWVRESQAVDLGTAGTARNRDMYGVLSISLGFLLFRQRGMLGPTAQIPIGSDEGSVGAGVSVALAVGGRS